MADCIDTNWGLNGEVVVSAASLGSRTGNADVGRDVNFMGAFAHSEPSLLEYRYPVKYWVPRGAHCGPCLWIYGVQFGGGLVEGDEAYSCAEKCETKLHHSFNVENDACLLVLPDLTMLYKDAVLAMQQSVSLKASSNLVFLDWFTAGRQALKESWEMKKVKCLTSIEIEQVLVFRDALEIGAVAPSGISVQSSMGKYKVFGICIVVGKVVTDLLSANLKQLSGGKGYGIAPDRTQIMASSPLYSNLEDSVVCGFVIRFCFYSTMQAYETMSDLLQPVFNLAGGNPFEKSY